MGEDGIVDTDNTGIVDALHLEGVNEGYTSARLQIEEVTTSFELADEGSLLNELSSMVKIVGTQNVTVQNTSGDTYTIEVEEDSTLGELLTAFRDAGLYANVENGVVELSGGKITGGTYDAITALGLDEDPLTSQVTGNALTETIVEYELVTYDTRLVDDLGVKEGYMEVIDSEGDAQYLKIYSGQTIGDLMSDLANMGIYSTLDEDNGILSITGGEFNTLTDADVNALINAGTIRETEARYMQGTDLLTALYGAPAISVNQTAVSQTYAMSRALSKSYTQVISATEATTMSELGINSTQTITLHKEDGSTATFDISGATTVGGLLTNIRNNGVTATLDDGVIYLEGGWMENAAVEEALGLEHSTASSYVLGTVRTVTKTHDADSDTTLAEMGLGTSTISIKGVDGVEVGSITTNADMTIGDILSALAGYGISGTIKDGVISLDSDIGNWAEGGVLDNFGISTTTSTFTTTAGVTNSSSSEITHTYTVTANGSSTMGELGLSGDVTVKGVNGEVLGSVAVDSDMTMTELFAALAAYGIESTISGGVVSMESKNGAYAEGGVVAGMNMQTSSTTTTQTIGTSHSSSALTATYTIVANGNTTFGDLGISGSATVYGVDGATLGSVAVGSDMTIDSFLAALASYGIEGSMSGGVVSLSSTNGAYATGSVITAMGIGTTSSTTVETIGTSTSGGAITHQTVTYETTFPTLTRTLITTATVVTTDPVIGTQTVTVRDTVTTTEPVIGTQTITVNHTHTSTVAEIGTKTVTVTDTVTVPVANVGSQTLLITHQHVCTEAVVGSETIYITSQVVWTSTLTKMTTISKSYSTNVVQEYSRTVEITTSTVVPLVTTSYTTEGVSMTSSEAVTSISVTTTSAGATASLPSGSSKMNEIAGFKDLFEAYGDSYTVTFKFGCCNGTTAHIDPVDGGNGYGSMTFNGTTTYSEFRIKIENAIAGAGVLMIDGSNGDHYLEAGDFGESYEGCPACWIRVEDAAVVATNYIDFMWDDGVNYFVGFYAMLETGGSTSTSTTTVTATSSSTVVHFGTDMDGRIITVYDVAGTAKKTITINSTTTFSGINTALGSYGDLSVSSGKVTISPASGYYITVSQQIADGLHFSTTGGTTIHSSETTGSQTIQVTGSTVISGKTTTPVTWSFSTVVQEVTGTKSITSPVVATITVDNVTTTVVTHKTVTTTVVEKTTTAPVTYTVSDTFTVNTVNYRTVTHNLSTTTIVEKTTTKEVTYTVEQTFTVEHTTTTPVTITVYGTAVYSTTTVTVTPTTSTVSMTGQTKFSQIGQGASVSGVCHGQAFSVSGSGDETINDFLTALAGFGISGEISGGVLTLTCAKGSYITSASGLGLSSAYTTQTHTITSNDGAGDALSYTLTSAMTSATTFTKLGGSASFTVVSDGVQHVVSASGEDTVGDLIDTLAGLGIKASISGGVLTLEGDEQAYVVGSTGVFNMGSAYTTTVHTITTNTSGDSQFYETTDTMTTESTFKNYGGGGSITVFSNGKEVTISVGDDDTLDDLFTQLAAHGIEGRISNGIVYLTGDNEAYITSISGLAGLKLGTTNYTTATHTITANTDSDHLTHDVTTLMSDETTLADLGITGGNIKITEKGVDYTVNINTGTMLTIGDFRNLLTDYGFTSYIDDKGRLVVMGDGDSYLTSIAGGSNILTQLDIDDWTFGKMTQVSSHLTDTTIESDGRVNGDTLITELQDSSGNSLGITTGEYTVYSNGVRTVETIDADTTVDDFIATLGTYGMVANVATDGSIQIGAQHNSYLATSASAGANTNLISTLFADWNFVNVYTSNNIEIPEDVVVSMTRETKLADINEGVYEDGCITVVHDGIQTNISLTADDTVGTLMDELALYGFDSVINDSGQLIIKSDGDSKLQAYIGGDKASNLLNLLGIQTANWIQTNSYVNDEIQTYEIVTSHYDATDDTLLSDLDLTWNDNVLKAQGQIGVTVDGFKHSINISADETFGSLKEKFAALGLEATISNGIFMIQSGYKEFEIDTANTTSNVVNDFALAFSDDLGGYSASNDNVEQTISWTEDVVLSVSNYADYDTAMSLLNISSGTLSVFRNGERATINVDSEETFGQLRARIATAFADVDIKFEDGYLKFYSNSGASVELGATTDTSNIAAICGFVNDKSGTVKSARELYRVNGDSKITTAGLFRRGDVTEGTFTVGDAVFTIDGNTSLYSIISQINASESSNATANWDSVDGKLVIKSRTTGSSFINIEAGTSNFTDIMGYTTTEVDGATGAVIAKRLDVNTQDVGDNAIFTINGTTYSSTSNTIKSDISRITGVTVNLKGVSEGEEITLTVERDKETVANAVSDIVDAYNDLIENVDKEIAKGAALDDQFTLKLVRNQIRSLMTSSLGGAGVFKNLDTVGISLNAATAGDIRTDNINILNFDKDKFLKAFDADRDALKDLLVGTETNLGIFSRVENIVEQALTSSYGYFSSAEKSYNTQIQRFDNKIKKANEAVERYRERLEAKFASMDLLISNMQNQYSSFLGV